MKPLGPIPAGFSSVEGELAVQGIAASELVERAGVPSGRRSERPAIAAEQQAQPVAQRERAPRLDRGR